MPLYQIALFVHILAVLGMFLATGVELLILQSFRRAQTIEQVREWVRLETPLGPIFSVVTLLLIGAGITMLLLGHLDWRLPWIDVPFVVLIVMNIVGATSNASRFRAIQRAVEGKENGLIPPALVSKLADPVLWTSILTIATMGIGIVYMMTLKPDWIGTALTTLISLAAGFALGQWQYRRMRPLPQVQPKAEIG